MAKPRKRSACERPARLRAAKRRRKRRRRPGPALPRLRIFDTCANLIRTLPALRHDERKPEDAAVTPHELTHAPDALRGFCTYWSTVAHAPEAAVHDILRDDFNMKKPTAGPLGQGGKYRVI